MKKIRIGKDISIQWTILTNGEAQSFNGRDLSVILTDPIGVKNELPFVVDGNILRITYAGTQHKRLGTYRITLWENYGKEGQTAVDHCNPFTLVPTTCNEEGDNTGSNLKAESVNLGTSDMQLNPVYGIYSKNIRYIEKMTQEEYDALEVKNESTLYIIVG